MSNLKLLLCGLLIAPFFLACSSSNKSVNSRSGFVATRDLGFVVDGRPFRFVGANVAVMYAEDERARMPETLAQVARDGVKVIRVWAYGEGSEADKSSVGSVGGDSRDWPRRHPFRPAPDEWNEEAFIHLDHVLAEAAKNNLRVQLCLTNWWRDTGGVTQYLRWAGIADAADDKAPYGINVERAMLFYSNEEARRLYRQHVERIVGRRNSVTGTLYKDDPTIFAYELMNEAQAPAGRWDERRAWVAEMSAYIKSLDPAHLVTTGSWGYRTSWERRAWLAEHSLPAVDFCDVHNYPRDDLDSFVDSPAALDEFMDNRAAAAFSLNKPLVFGEFGMAPEGYKGVTEAAWFRAYFSHAQRVGASGAMYWIFTPDPQRGYGVTYITERDREVRAEFKRAADFFNASADARPPEHVLDFGQHLIPRQFAFSKSAGEIGDIIAKTENDKLIYRFSPEQAARGRFERIGGGGGYVWGNGMGFFEYLVPERSDWRRVGEINVRAHLQPVPPYDARGRLTETSVTLLINNKDCGTRLIGTENPEQPATQEWRVDNLSLRFAAATGQTLSIKLAVTPTAEKPYGLNITKYANDDITTRAPVEVELK